ncbi:hypothetical protein [Leisingera caerulea]|uniref:Uncharacterized protein n=1 Tax=Leisingera caerulea TaxID=506591 RepID=A0A9Q9M000_LEICA|nr:hypothetical protein [Leisingera caerulea]UWQ53107.1 hypothetical protein K3721_13955 [Leisingera caerulea]
MREGDLKDFSNFLEEFQGESDRGAALVGAALIDLQLSETLKAFFVESSSTKALLSTSGPLGSLNARILSCHALGLIDDTEKDACTRIAGVRNKFAHLAHGTSFETQAIADQCKGFKLSLPGKPNDFKDKPRLIFINAVVLICLRLTYRSDWVAKERRTTKSWPY